MKKLVMACLALCTVASILKAQTIALITFDKNWQIQKAEYENLDYLLRKQVNFSNPEESELTVENNGATKSYTLNTVVRTSTGENVLARIKAWVETSTNILRISHIYVGHTIYNEQQPHEYADYYGVRHPSLSFDLDNNVACELYDITASSMCCPQDILFYEKAMRDRMKSCAFQENNRDACPQKFDYFKALL